MNKWVVVVTENGVLNRVTFNQETLLLKGMKGVIEASQLWDMRRFTQWVRNAKAGQWLEIRDDKNRIRALVVRSSDPKGWWV